jgi:predicted glycosyltransferase
MKIFIDIGHPAHVHYIKNFIFKMKQNGHSIFITARDKEVVFSLLDYYSIPYVKRGSGKNSLIGKLWYMVKADIVLLKHALKFKPDLFLSFGSPYAAQVSWLLRKPHLALDDTDHNALQHALYVPFTKVILTPEVFKKNFGQKHIRFDGFLELGGLHPNQFIPQKLPVNDLINIDDSKDLVILRFVSWNATHDYGLKGLTQEYKYYLLKVLSRYATVVISSEVPLPDDMKKYAYQVHPARMPDMLNAASLLISESLTMAAEAAFIGTPTLCYSAASAGTLNEEVRLGLIEIFRKPKGLLERALEILKDKNYKAEFQIKSNEIIKTKVDLTSFLVWFVENYPESFAKMKKDPSFQNSFKEIESALVECI